jgi:hypothetical protein
MALQTQGLDVKGGARKDWPPSSHHQRDEVVGCALEDSFDWS